MSMETVVFAKLTDEQRQERHASLLHHLGEAERLEAKKKADAKSTQELIDHEWSECYRLRRVLLDDAEARRQGDLRFGDEVVPSTVEATAALASVAALADECPSCKATILPGETACAHCHTTLPTLAPKPTDPHVFVSDPNIDPEAQQCDTCGAPQVDPVHHGGEQILPHVYSPDESEARPGVIPADVCAFPGCGRSGVDSVHAIHGLNAEEIAEAFIAADRALFCPACQHRTCTVHPHAFVEGGEPDNRCGGCGRGRRARVHQHGGDKAEAETSSAPGEPAEASA